MTGPVLQVEGLTKRFGDLLAVDDVSFRIDPRETVGILGPNGAGKTTTIHMLLGLITPDSGSLRVLGRDPLTDRSVLQEMNFAAAYVSFPNTLTVRENLIVFAKLYGVRDARRRVEHVLEILGALHLRDRVTRQLSSGQATVIHLAKSLLNSPRLLLLDEPTASLDPDAGSQVRRQLQWIAEEEEMTLLVTSHNMKEVAQMCDRILFLHRGRVVAEGSPGELSARFGAEDLEEVFLKLARGSQGR